MHEGAVCREIMEITENAAKANDLREIFEIVVSAGPYSCLHEAQLNFYFDAAKENTCMAKAYIRVELDESLQGNQQMFIKTIRGE